MSKNCTWDADREKVAALASGWTAADLDWERGQERALMLAEKRETGAAELWRECLEMARIHFAGDDPRLGVSYANAAAASGGTDSDLLHRARSIWLLSPAWIDRARMPRRGRSSAHHFRMEMKNSAVYETAFRRKLHVAAAAARRRVEKNNALTPAAAARCLQRWLAEKPVIFDDGRKVLAACFLLISDD